MYAAAFTLDLYCENDGQLPRLEGGSIYLSSGHLSTDGVHPFNIVQQYVAYDRRQAFAEARRDGWKTGCDVSWGTCWAMWVGRSVARSISGRGSDVHDFD